MKAIFVLTLVLLAFCEGKQDSKKQSKKTSKHHRNSKISIGEAYSERCEIFCSIRPMDIQPSRPLPQPHPHPVVRPTESESNNPSSTEVIPESTTKEKSKNKTRIANHQAKKHQKRTVHYLSKEAFKKLSKTHHRLSRGRVNSHTRNFPPNCNVYCLEPVIQNYVPEEPPQPEEEVEDDPGYEGDEGDEGYEDENSDDDSGDGETSLRDDYSEDTYVPGEDTAVEITLAPAPRPLQNSVQLEDFGADGNPAGDPHEWSRKRSLVRHINGHHAHDHDLKKTHGYKHKHPGHHTTHHHHHHSTKNDNHNQKIVRHKI